MNGTERRMVQVLSELKEAFGAASVKAEFEAEGTRIDELLRLLDISSAAGLPLTLKVGGCEAIRDLLEAKQFGARYVVAPMVETPYALRKFISASGAVYRGSEMEDVDLLFNLETISAFDCREQLMAIAGESPTISGVVFGRVDFMGSLDRTRDSVDGDDVTRSILQVARLSRDEDLDLVVGGGVGIDSLGALRQISEVHLTRFETRKVVFSKEALDVADVERGLLQAVYFELQWLLNKRDYYDRITHEDEKRIAMLEDRWQVLQKFGT